MYESKSEIRRYFKFTAVDDSPCIIIGEIEAVFGNNDPDALENTEIILTNGRKYCVMESVETIWDLFNDID